MQTVLIVIHLMIVLALVGVVLIQRSEGGGLGVGGGSGFMSARGAANALTRTTAILATLFFITSLGLGILSRYESRPTDILDRITPAGQTNGRGVLDSLGGNKPATGSAPATTTPAAPASGQAAPAPATPEPATPVSPAPATPVAPEPATPVSPAPAQSGVPTGQ
jgi:preprotein translocase subunit SecG